MFFKRKKSKPEPITEVEELASTDADASQVEPEISATEEQSAEQPKKPGFFGRFTGKSEPVAEPEALEPSVAGDSSEEPEEKLKEEPENVQLEDPQVEPKKKKPSFFERIKAGLARTGKPLSSGLSALLLGKKSIDDDLLEELETLLLTSDIGVDATESIIDTLTDKVARKQLSDGESLHAELKKLLVEMLKGAESPLVIDTTKQPYVILVVGVNGVGKTTTIGKLAKRFQNDGHSVMLAAGDTFRAAAVEQLQTWGDRNNVPVVAQHTGADSASVIFDALQSAKSRGIDVLIADTAGRLHNKSNLMEELSKVKRVMGKIDDSAPHEVLLVLDAGTGQNAVNQLDQFKETANVSGLVLTKLDGTAKGGVIFALSKKHQTPVRFIGVGESVDDLQPFDAEQFVEALFS